MGHRMTLNEAIGKTVRGIRKGRGLTLFDVCKATDFVLREPRLSLLERDRSEWRAVDLELVASAFGLNPRELLPKG